LNYSFYQCQKYLIMRKNFNNRLDAIEWIVANAKNEGQFELMRENLTYNFIYHSRFFLNMKDCEGEVEMLKGRKEEGKQF